MWRGVTVVIPTYNSASFVRETLDSVFSQIRLPDEVVVVDDASTDETAAIVQAIAVGSPIPLRLIRLPTNTGAPAIPMNVGIEAAKGDLIALLDHDDLMLPQKIAAEIAAMQKYPEIELVMGDYESFSSQGVLPHRRARSLSGEWHELLTPGPGPVHRVEAGDFLFAFFSVDGLQGGCSNMFFRKSLWARAGGFDAATGATSDHDFILRAVDRPVAWIDQILFRRRQHDSNLSHVPREFSPLVYTRHLRALVREYTNAASRLRRASLKARVANCLLECAYQYREAGHYRNAVKTYLDYLAWGGSLWFGLKGIAKILAYCPRDLFTKACAIACSRGKLAES